MDEEMKQKLAAIFFNKSIPVNITTKKGSWLNGYIKEYSAEFIIVYDRYDKEVLVFFNEIDVIRQFIGDVSSLKRWDEDE